MRLNLKWMKAGLAMAIAGCAISVHAADVAAQDPAELAKLVEKQNKQIEMLMQRLDQIEKKQAEDTAQVKKVVMETNAALADTNKKVETSDSKLTLGKGIDGLKITGDARVRAEMRSLNAASGAAVTSDRSRFRERFRVGGIWTNKAENWEIGAGLATGTDANGRSGNADWGMDTKGAYDHLSIWLDYAYAKHKWSTDDGTPVSLTLGKQKGAFVTSGLDWKDDLRPEGVTLQYGDAADKEYYGGFATGGAYLLQYLSNGTAINGVTQQSFDQNVYDFHLQGGYKLRLNENDDYLLGALGYETITGAYRNSAAATLFQKSSNPSGSTAALNTGYDYNIADAYLAYRTTVGGVELKPFGHMSYNFGASGNRSQQTGSSTTGDGKLGWALGIEAKKAKWSFGYTYLYVGSDSVFGPLRDSDFGETAGLVDTDVQGHLFKVGYDVTKNFTLGASYYMLDRISPVTAGTANNAKMLQLDAVYKV